MAVIRFLLVWLAAATLAVSSERLDLDLHLEFDAWTIRHDTAYNSNDREYLERRAIYLKNQQLVDTHNHAYQQGWTKYSMTLEGPFADRTHEEFKATYLMEGQNCSATHTSSGKVSSLARYCIDIVHTERNRLVSFDLLISLSPLLFVLCTKDSSRTPPKLHLLPLIGGPKGLLLRSRIKKGVVPAGPFPPRVAWCVITDVPYSSCRCHCRSPLLSHLIFHCYCILSYRIGGPYLPCSWQDGLLDMDRFGGATIVGLCRAVQ
jgi:hypothetical protein